MNISEGAGPALHQKIAALEMGQFFGMQGAVSLRLCAKEFAIKISKHKLGYDSGYWNIDDSVRFYSKIDFYLSKRGTTIVKNGELTNESNREKRRCKVCVTYRF